MGKTAYDKGYEQGYAEAIEVVRKTKITPTQEQIDYIRKKMDLLSTPLEDIPVIAIEIWEKIRRKL